MGKTDGSKSGATALETIDAIWAAYDADMKWGHRAAKRGDAFRASTACKAAANKRDKALAALARPRLTVVR